MTLRKRFRGVILRLGEPISLGESETRAILTGADETQLAGMLSPGEAATVGGPLRLAYLAYDAEAASGTTVETSDGTATAIRILDLRYQGETFARMALLAASAS